MNYTLIVLGIVVAILIYVLYLYFSDDSQQVTDYHNCNDSAMVIQEKDLKQHSSLRYAMECGYTNSWSSNQQKLYLNVQDL